MAKVKATTKTIKVTFGKRRTGRAKKRVNKHLRTKRTK